MNITFFVGNGFDRNLGLKTTYSDFVQVYKKSNPATDILRDFRKHIRDNEELWSSAEEEMGRYTAQFDAGAGAAFYECHKDFCESLAGYLKKESRRVEYQYIASDVEKAFSRMNSIITPFPTQERELLDSVYQARKDQAISFNFIVFNYTNTLDECVSLIKDKQSILGQHTHGAYTYKHHIGGICHVHGTVDTQMVFGVNDTTQIAKPEIFDCEYGDLYEELLIKRQANQGYQENTDAKAKKILDDSNIIYIYGMSIGTTDAIWWERVCSWLSANTSHHLIVHKYSMPSRGLLEVDYKIEERKGKREITKYSKLPDNQKREMETRIHITGDNIFAELKDITVKRELANEAIKEMIDQVAASAREVINSQSFQAATEFIEKRGETLVGAANG